MDPDSEISFDFSPFLVQYKSGRVFRHGSDATVPAGNDPLTGVVSKDIHVGAARARVYLPPGTAPTAKLPVIVYFHGGAFVVGSPARPSTHGYLNDLVARAGAIGVSVYYHLAPEHALPAAYEDGWAAVLWAATLGDGADPWLLDHADLSRVFLAGCSSGANLAHNMAIRASATGALPDDVTVRGLLAVHPYFNGKEAVGAEASLLGHEVREKIDRRWRFLFPGSPGLDDPHVNPFGNDDTRAAVAKIPCERVLVCAAENDFLKERALWYYQELKASGYAGAVELFESKGVGHGFHFDKPQSEEGVELQQRMVAFITK